MLGFLEPREMLRSFEARGMFGCTSWTDSYARELISVSMCYSQGDGLNTSLFGLLCLYCTLSQYWHCYRVVVYVCCVWLCSVVRPYVTQDDVNKDDVCTPTMSPVINRPPHPDHLAYTRALGLRNSTYMSFIGVRLRIKGRILFDWVVIHTL